jgi:hypothetical protein
MGMEARLWHQRARKHGFNVGGHGGAASTSASMEAGVGDQMHDDVQTISDGLRSGPHGLRFGLRNFYFILTKQFLVPADLSDCLQYHYFWCRSIGW